MLAEKFFLVLETIRSHAFDDKPSDGCRSQVPISSVAQTPVRPPNEKHIKTAA
ncbi:hypothetical protein [Rhodopseudomonas boonkerdii]|uniref:hypothetical protein n=1 Tax=Rhodopseudomonas boonkerdii TaxID=475937 RepID=UPI001E4932F2|nr:hypothetical protein [Rhodopseudomonas boonkerdii]